MCFDTVVHIVVAHLIWQEKKEIKAIQIGKGEAKWFLCACDMILQAETLKMPQNPGRLTNLAKSQDRKLVDTGQLCI